MGVALGGGAGEDVLLGEEEKTGRGDPKEDAEG